MAGVTKRTIDEYVIAFHTALAAGDLKTAEDALIDAEIELQSIPDTDQLRFHGSLTALRDMLEKRWARDSTKVARRLLLRRDRS